MKETTKARKNEITNEKHR